MATSRRTIASTLAAFALASVVLVGCSAGAPDAGPSGDDAAAPSSQTTEEACAVLKDGVAGTMEELQAGLTELKDDPDAASAAVGTLADAFEDTATDVKNAEVRAITDDATEALNTFDTQIAAYASDPQSVDPAAVTGAATAVQDAMLKLGTTCP